MAPQGRKHFLIVLTDAAQKLALDSDRCVQILREAGHLDTKSPSRLVDLGNIPDDAAELERYLREQGANPLALKNSSR